MSSLADCGCYKGNSLFLNCYIAAYASCAVNIVTVLYRSHANITGQAAEGLGTPWSSQEAHIILCAGIVGVRAAGFCFLVSLF